MLFSRSGNVKITHSRERTTPPPRFGRRGRRPPSHRPPRPGGQDAKDLGEEEAQPPPRGLRASVVSSPTSQQQAQNSLRHRRGHHPPAPRACAPRRQDRQAGGCSSNTGQKQILGITMMPAVKGRANRCRRLCESLLPLQLDVQTRQTSVGCRLHLWRNRCRVVNVDWSIDDRRYSDETKIAKCGLPAARENGFC